MAKIDLKKLFWPLPVHRYQKKSPLMIAFVARGRRRKLVFHRNFIAEKKNVSLKYYLSNENSASVDALQ